ncbi:FecCD family ABC transporter permease [Paenibacillus xerothermodurans]|uniref:Iron ABC transporter permease n=1 Tax=Paenibacillus xerothermodurans TaxID=1977292 RepID=A0A2W1N578_PAEXE|nr:iron ABC transporter permease [Paenibacillus xerothermodurans]PZE19859.1 iron ABC transporter permease [Paenibacillus xerothermodurans]
MKFFGLFLCLIVLSIAICCSIVFGVTDIRFQTVIESYTGFNGSNEHLIIQTTRVPRAVIAAAVGASLAVAGAVMQAITRNPLASPSILGVNSGAAFFIVVAASCFHASGFQEFTWIAFIGSATSTAIVYVLGSLGRDGLTPIKITLAGAAVTAFFHSLTQGFLLADGKMFDQILIWLVGSVAGRDVAMLHAVYPYMIAGLAICLFLSKHINLLALGEDVAAGLGQRTVLVKLTAAVGIVLLAGASVAVAGPIAFVGIIIPHVVRYLVGNDYRWIVPFSALLGAILLVSADLSSRYIAMPSEVPVGVMTAILGVPFFVYIARKGARV